MILASTLRCQPCTKSLTAKHLLLARPAWLRKAVEEASQIVLKLQAVVQLRLILVDKIAEISCSRPRALWLVQDACIKGQVVAKS